ncbi:MAG: SBBP repeat-containing protein [Candidatus Sumerlaeota bacterium]|nr:SBBP repeat-containing protein [Candidatus Sumerlaeota bacterium]
MTSIERFRGRVSRGAKRKGPLALAPVWAAALLPTLLPMGWAADATMEWSTFLGGSDKGYGRAVAVDSSSNVYLAGKTCSSDFPTLNPFDAGHAVDEVYGSAFVMKVSPTGTKLWATYLGDTGEDAATAIAVDSSGLYVVGETNSASFDLLNAYDSTLGGWCDAFVTKIGLDGTLLWSTYLGGADYDAARAVAIDSNGDVYVGGTTQSGDFPSLGGYDTTAASGSDGFVTKFNSSGVLQWSTYFGGNGAEESVNAIAAAPNGSIAVCGTTDSTNFPTLNAYDSTANGSSDIFVATLSAAGALLGSTYLGGTSFDACEGCATDASSAIYIVGRAMSTDFPVPNGQYTAHAGGDWDGIIAKLTSPSALAWATYLGGSDADGATAIACRGRDLFLAGYTWSANFPLTAGSGTAYSGKSDAFLARASANGTLTWARYLGGASYDLPSGVAIDSGGKVAVTGYTQSAGFPTPGGFDTAHNGKVEGFATRYSSAVGSASRLWRNY